MAHIRKVGTKELYWCVDAACIGRACLALGNYQHRGAIGAAGSKSSGYSLMCMTNAYHGCPREKPIDRALAAERRKEGYRVQV